MGAQGTRAFGDLHRDFRRAAELTQEALAERAGVSARSIQNLERGETRPLKDTARRIAAALGLGERDRALILTAVTQRPRRRAPSPAVAPPAGQAGPRLPAGPTPPMPAAVPPAPPRHNLPAALSSFIGREREQARVAALVREARLVALVGPGGVGKTRLALAVAEDLATAYPDGVWLVELAPLADAGLVPSAVAQVLGVREGAGRSIVETLTDHLKGKHLLLVLDNCEHLVGLAGASEQPRRAARLGGAAEALREVLGVPLQPEQRADHDRAVGAVRAALGEEAFAVAWAEGRALPLAEAVALALEGGAVAG